MTEVASSDDTTRLGLSGSGSRSSSMSLARTDDVSSDAFSLVTNSGSEPSAGSSTAIGGSFSSRTLIVKVAVSVSTGVPASVTLTTITLAGAGYGDS